jgi:hypothetical protein
VRGGPTPKIDHDHETKKRHLTAEFKARVTLEALKEDKTIQQIAIDEVWCTDITYLPMEKGHA